MAIIKVKVAKISAKTSNGNYLHTIKTEGVEHEALGRKVVTGKRTYFLAMQDSECWEANTISIWTSSTLQHGKLSTKTVTFAMAIMASLSC